MQLNHTMQPNPNSAKPTASQPQGNPACHLSSPDAGSLSLAHSDPALFSQQDSPELATNSQLPRSVSAPAAKMESHAAASVRKQPRTSAQGAQIADSQWGPPPQTSLNPPPDVGTGKYQPDVLPLVDPREPTWQEVLKGLKAVGEDAGLAYLMPASESEVICKYREQMHAVWGGPEPGAEPRVAPDDNLRQYYDQLEASRRARCGLGRKV